MQQVTKGRLERLARLEELVTLCGLTPADLMFQLRKERRTRARFFHELEEELLSEQTTDAERLARKMGKIA